MQGKNAGNPDGFPSILTKAERKIRPLKSSSDMCAMLNPARVELATLQTAKFPFVFTSKLEIRRYICVFRLRRDENFARFKFKEVCAAAFFQSARHEFAGRLTPFKNECKSDEQRRRAKPYRVRLSPD